MNRKSAKETENARKTEIRQLAILVSLWLKKVNRLKSYVLLASEIPPDIYGLRMAEIILREQGYLGRPNAGLPPNFSCHIFSFDNPSFLYNSPHQQENLSLIYPISH